MAVSQKCQYALRALFELAKRYERGPCKISDVATAQRIPPRFLEVILNELKQGGFVDSRRGKEGGYYLVRRPSDLTAGDVIRFVEGPIHPVERDEDESARRQDVFDALWNRAEVALCGVYDETTMESLIEQEAAMRKKGSLDFMI
ncbi:Rrf2 family transcriptional regulator [soil metagenome]